MRMRRFLVIRGVPVEEGSVVYSMICIYFYPTINTRDWDCFRFLQSPLFFKRTEEKVHLWHFLCRNVLPNMIQAVNNRLVSPAFRRLGCWWEPMDPDRLQAPWGNSDGCPMDYYGNEVTQMFRKTIIKQAANTEIIAIKAL